MQSKLSYVDYAYMYDYDFPGIKISYLLLISEFFNLVKSIHKFHLSLPFLKDFKQFYAK